VSGPKCRRCNGLLVAVTEDGKTIHHLEHVRPCTNPATNWERDFVGSYVL